jgi:hypothetical protein
MLGLVRSTPRRLDRAKKLLEVRKLEIEVAVLKAANPHVGASLLDEQISRILELPPDNDAVESRLPWIERLKLAGIGVRRSSPSSAHWRWCTVADGKASSC